MENDGQIKLLIAGSRTITDYNVVSPIINNVILRNFDFGNSAHNFWDNVVLISGGADGVDKHGEHFAKLCGIPEDRIRVIEPDWNPNGVYDRNAGKKRNTTLVNECTHAIVIWDPNSPTHGTLDTVKKLIKAKKPFWFYSILTPTQEDNQTELEL